MGWADYEDHAAAYNRLPLSLYSGHVERTFFKKTFIIKKIYLPVYVNFCTKSKYFFTKLFKTKRYIQQELFFVKHIFLFCATLNIFIHYESLLGCA